MITASTNMGYVASAWQHVKKHHLIDPLLSVIEHEDTIAEYREQELMETLDNRFEEIIPLGLPELTESERHLMGFPTDAELDEAMKALCADIDHLIEPVSSDRVLAHKHRSSDLMIEYPLIAEPQEPVSMNMETFEFPAVIDDEPEVTVLPTKKVVAAAVHRTAPEGFDLGPSELEESDLVRNSTKVTMIKKTVNAPALLDWLAEISVLDFNQVQEELVSKSGRVLFAQLRKSLWLKAEGIDGQLNKESADELESLGYVVSYNRTNGTMVVELKSVTLRWMCT